MTDYLGIAEAARRAAIDGEDSGRAAVLTAIQEGLIHARAYRAKVTELAFDESGTDEIRALLASDQPLRTIGNLWLRADGKRSELETYRPFQGSDATPFTKCPDQQWVKFSTNDQYYREVRSHWKMGRFSICSLFYHTPWPDHETKAGFHYYEYNWFGVEVEAEPVGRLLVPQIATGSEPRTVDSVGSAPTQFDWEAAIADVAACFHFDVQFQNPSARGVQQEIVKLLRQSFEARGLPEPGDTILKAKAAKIQAALRSHKSV